MTRRGCAHAFASFAPGIGGGFCQQPAMVDSDYCERHDPAHPVDGLSTVQQRARPRRAQRSPMSGGPLNQAAYAKWLTARCACCGVIRADLDHDHAFVARLDHQADCPYAGEEAMPPRHCCGGSVPFHGSDTEHHHRPEAQA